MPIPIVDLGPILANSGEGPLLNEELGPSALPLALFTAWSVSMLDARRRDPQARAWFDELEARASRPEP